MLVLVTAALAGALVMKSVLPSPTAEALPPTPVALSAPAAAAAPAIAAVAPRSVPVPAATSKPTVHSKPASPSVVREANANPPIATTRAVACATCGTVESVDAVQVKGEGTGLGAVAGGVLGGVVGHQTGGGNGKTAMTVLGAIGGGLAGNEVERRTRSETTYDVHVRMEDGSQRVIRQSASMAVGAHVIVDGNQLRVATESPTREPGLTRTSTTAARGS